MKGFFDSKSLFLWVDGYKHMKGVNVAGVPQRPPAGKECSQCGEYLDNLSNKDPISPQFSVRLQKIT
ncbi:MAG: hypothetical protein QE284_13730 [Rhizobium sp.]|nr:hypothetical protein [Rhizobium sp.]